MTKRKTSLTVIILLIIFLCVALSGVMLGSVKLSFGQILNGIFGTDETSRIILQELRLPRVIAALLAGVGLSTAGLILQTVTDNKLCAPNIIGINAGAGLAVMLLTCFFPLLWELLPFAAFVGALLTAFTVLGISSVGTGKGKKTSVVLAGVAVSAMMNSGISFLSLKYPDALPSYAAFSVGGFSGVKMKELLIPSVIIFLCFLLSMMLAPKLRLLCLGDDAASTLGINVKAVRISAVLLASALSASVVSFAGLIGFVGLVVPHIAGKISGGGLRITFITSALCGGILVMLSDLVGRALFSPGEIPAGVFLAFIGAPFFLWLLIKGRNNI